METPPNMFSVADVRGLFEEEICNVANNRMKIDGMCAFYFAAAYSGAFYNMAHRYQEYLERQTEELSATQSGQDMTTGLLQDYNNARLLEATQAAAQRLKVALDRVQKGNEHLPPWGPPLLPGDARIEELDEWIFPVPWMPTDSSESGNYIRMATATPEDPTIRSRIVPIEHAARADIPPATAAFWRTERRATAPGTLACERIAREGTALARAASSGRAQAGPSATRAPSGGAARVSAPPTTGASRDISRIATSQATVTPGTTAQTPNYYVPPSMTNPTRRVGAATPPATAAARGTARANVPQAGRALGSTAEATSDDTARGRIPPPGGRSRGNAPADSPPSSSRRPGTEPSKDLASAGARTSEQKPQLRVEPTSSSGNVPTRYGSYGPREEGRAPSAALTRSAARPPVRRPRDGRNPDDVVARKA
jgi:hypothetical protein